MRIIGGIHKGIILHPPKGLPVRPTTDRAKESLFNIIENNFDTEGCDVLDLFAGTGNIGLEFCSRGAVHIDSVDINEKCIAWIKQAKEKYGMQELHPLRMDAFSFLKSCKRPYDIIFADAPYAHKNIIEIPRLVAANHLLKKDGWLIVEHEAHLDLNAETGFFDKRTYGQSAFSFFRQEPQQP